MFRVICAVSALFAALAVSSAAQARPEFCNRVDIRFACRSGATGAVTLNCARGETRERCCARHRARAADPRRGFCTGRDGGLVRFACACARGGGGGGRVELLPREAGEDLPRLAPADEEETGRGRGRERPRALIEEAGPGRGAGGARRCPRVGYAFACRGEGSASGNFACGRGEDERSCCARVARIARESCQRKGGVARFRCACLGGGRPGNADGRGGVDRLEER